MRIERAGALIQLFGVQEIYLLVRLFVLPAGGFLQIRKQFVRQPSQHARHVQIECGGFRAVRREPSFAHRLSPELIPRRAGHRDFLGVPEFLHPTRE